MVGDLVETHGNEVHDHDFSYWLVTSNGSTNCSANDGSFRNRGLTHTVCSVFCGEALGDFVHATRWLGNVFAQQENFLVETHCDVHSFVEREAHRNDAGFSSGHGCLSLNDFFVNVCVQLVE